MSMIIWKRERVSVILDTQGRMWFEGTFKARNCHRVPYVIFLKIGFHRTGGGHPDDDLVLLGEPNVTQFGKF